MQPSIFSTRGLRHACAALTLAAMTSAIFAPGAAAQNTTSAQGNIPGSVDPGRVQQRLQPAPRPAPAPALVVPEIPENVPPADAAQTRFALRKVVIDDSSVYASTDIQPLYEPLLNKTVSLSDIYRIADAVTTKYRSDGYILSRAVVPAQRIADGEVHIRVVEGFVRSVIFEGPQTPAIVAYGEIVKRSHPLRAADLERCLLLMHDLPGTTVRGVLAPAAGVTGGSDLTIIIERNWVSAFVSLDNRGTSLIGPLQFFSEASVNDITGNSDHLGARFITTPANPSELRYVEFHYTVPLGGDGASLLVSGSWNRSLPGGALQSAGLRTQADGTTVYAQVSYPLIRTRRRSLVFDAAFVYRNASVDQLALPSRTRLVSSYDDRVRDIHLGISYDDISRWRGRDFVRLELVQGLPVLGASDNARLTNTSRPGGRSTFTRGNFEASRVQSLDGITPGFGVLAGITSGWSFGQSLLASEQFSIGGTQYGRGYDPSELTGDYGIAGKIEPQYNFRPNLRSIPSLSQLMEDVDVPFFQLFAFVDYGAVWDQNPGLLGAPDRARTLLSTGLGLRANIRDRFIATVEGDKGLTRRVAAFADSGNPKPWRVYFSIVGKF